MVCAYVNNVEVQHDTHDISTFGGTFKMAGQRRVKLEVEIVDSDPELIEWLIKSLLENGRRIQIEPDGSPIIRPVTNPSPTPALPVSDAPRTFGEAW